MMKIKQALPNKKAGIFFRDPENWLAIVIGLVMVLFMVKCISFAMTNVFSFDGAVNAQISQNLARNPARFSDINIIELFILNFLGEGEKN